MKQKDIAPFGVRMGDDLKGYLRERAKKNGRSMNAEIIQILKRALSDEGKRE